MVQPNPDIRISALEKIIVNWPTVFLTAYNTLKAELGQSLYSDQSVPERFQAIWDDKIKKYHKLLTIKELHQGVIPERVQELNKRTLCGYTRLLAAEYHDYLSRL